MLADIPEAGNAAAAMEVGMEEGAAAGAGAARVGRPRGDARFPMMKDFLAYAFAPQGERYGLPNLERMLLKARITLDPDISPSLDWIDREAGDRIEAYVRDNDLDAAAAYVENEIELIKQAIKDKFLRENVNSGGVSSHARKVDNIFNFYKEIVLYQNAHPLESYMDVRRGIGYAGNELNAKKWNDKWKGFLHPTYG